MDDIRDILFQNISKKRFRAVLTAERSGILSGVEAAVRKAEKLGIALELCKKEGQEIGSGEKIGFILAGPKQIAEAEECLIGTLAKPSGIATAAGKAVKLAAGKVKIVSGAWKKMPAEIKDPVRTAIVSGGASFRITEPPMVYLDKNFIRMFGSIPAALAACGPLKESSKVIQIRGEEKSIEEETEEAVRGGAAILMVDTGVAEDLKRCVSKLELIGVREKVQVSFAGNVHFEDIPALASLGADMLCIGKEIVDAPLLDLKLDVIGSEG